MEYQFYEFQAIDQPLSPSDLDVIGSLSSRVKPTPHQAVFTYSHGDLPRDPRQILIQYYDAMLYMASWGSRHLSFRLPIQLIDTDPLEAYTLEDVITISTAKDSLIVEITIQDPEIGGWIEGENWLTSLLPLRHSILEGDLRVLYLAWLRGAGLDPEQDPQEPPIPPGLSELSKPLQDWVTWLEIDPDLITAAAELSAALPQSDSESVEVWIASLSETEKDQILISLLQKGRPTPKQLRAQLQRQFSTSRYTPQPHGSPPRSFSELARLQQIHCEQREKEQHQRAEEQRRNYLKSLLGGEDSLWNEIHRLLARKQGSAYDAAIRLLIDLRDVAAFKGDPSGFRSQLHQIYRQYSNRPALLRRIEENGLMDERPR